jgi:hypothetical protein
VRERELQAVKPEHQCERERAAGGETRASV